MEEKLRTLKDLAHPHFFSQEKKGYVMEEDLKQEAIKWVKRYKKIKMRETTGELFIDFFNITEEDLK